jgi:hypothetical protein
MKNSAGRFLSVGMPLVAAAALAVQGAAAGAKWVVPAKWSEQPARQMRVVTYTVPAAQGDAEPGECAVFFFGKSQGGDPEANIQRWSGQFEGSPKPARSTRTVSGITMQIVEISGTYLPSAGPMMQASGKKPGYSLVGAIVPAPDGTVFFKMTGPLKTVQGARADFDALLASIKK